jgi:alpha-tubulin suppressor-like RCC1 family protein
MCLPRRTVLLTPLVCLTTPWLGTTAALAQGSASTRPTEPIGKVVGTQHFLALMADGRVIGWGRHRDGQLGEWALLNTRRRYGVAGPVPIALPGPAIDIAAGTSSSYALLADGTVWAWGRGFDGELGLGPAVRSARLPTGDPGITTPQRIAELHDIVQITAAGTVGYALRRDGVLFACGPRDAGLIGDGLVPPRWAEVVPAADRPVRVQLPALVAKLGLHTAGLAITTDGRVLEWPTPPGPAKSGDVWQPLNTAITEVPLPEPAIDIGSPGGARLALLRDGTVWAWGNNMQGLWGNGEESGQNRGLKLIRRPPAKPQNRTSPSSRRSQHAVASSGVV